MQAFVDDLIAQLLTLQINLYACCERLRAQTDAEALHDLRIAVRKLRSLLRPLRGLLDCSGLELAAQALGHISGPLRDAEVLLAQLHGRDPAAQRVRQQHLQAGYRQLLRSPQLGALFSALDAWVRACRQAQAAGQLRGAGKHSRKRLAKNLQALLLALATPGADRHRLRIVLKRLRYGAQAYPQRVALTHRQMLALSAAQSALGDWHDCQQWLLCAEQQHDLQPLVGTWQDALLVAERRSEQALQQLQAALLAGP
ncbi:MAG: CHAD domain-containing protein [Pseudomonas sp.]|nr:CHAD domain-containing protein [Pseudomonas sp.]